MIISFLAVLFWLVYLSLAYFNSSNQNEKWVTHTYEVLLHVEKLKSRIYKMHLSFRTFEVTGEPFLKERFNELAREARSEFDSLQQLTIDNPTTQQLLADKLIDLNEIIDRFNQRSDTLNYPLAASLASAKLPSFAADYELIEQSELALLKTRQQKAGNSNTYFELLISLTVALSFLAVLALLFGARVSIKKSAILMDEIATEKLAYELLFTRIGEVLFSRDAQNQSFLGISVTCESLFGYSADDFISDKFLWFKIIHQEDRHLALSGRLLLESGASVSNQYRITRQDGTTRWIEVSIVPFQDTSTGLERIDGVARDITKEKTSEIDREQLISELMDKNASLAKFGFEVSHNVRAPVANIISLFEILQNSTAAPEKDKEELISHLGKSVYLLDTRISNLNQLLSTKSFSK